MFHDATWQRLADEHERLLCSDCLLTRAIDRQVDLTLADLLPCAFNLFHRPFSWFDLFRKFDPPGAAVPKEWQQVMAAYPHLSPTDGDCDNDRR